MLDKILAFIHSVMGFEYKALTNYSIGTNITINPRPYRRVALAVPTFFSTNSLKYTAWMLEVPANSTSLKISTLYNSYNGQIVTSGTVDIALVIFAGHKMT